MRWPFRSRFKEFLVQENERLRREIEIARQRGDVESSRLRGRILVLEGENAVLHKALMDRADDHLYHLQRLANQPTTPRQMNEIASAQQKRSKGMSQFSFRDRQEQRRKRAQERADQMLKENKLPLLPSRADIERKFNREAEQLKANGSIGDA